MDILQDIVIAAGLIGVLFSVVAKFGPALMRPSTND